MTGLHDFTLRTIDGDDRPLSEYEGRAVLVVNVASECGLTPQYAELQALYEELRPRGLEVLGVPCNQFAGQEPGSEAEIKSFCTATFGVTFPMFAKVDVNGEGRHPLFAWLTSQNAEPEGAGDVKWNFGKFVVGKDGALLGRFEPTTSPRAPELLRLLEGAL